MKPSEHVARMEGRLALLEEENGRLRRLQCARRGVKVGDVWCYVPNLCIGTRNGHTGRVVGINRKKGVVRFDDEGWNGLQEMEMNPDWVLLGREYKTGDEDGLRPKKEVA